jgi:hypothetical protein
MQIKTPVNWYITAKQPPLGTPINARPFALTQINRIGFFGWRW